MSKKGAVSVSYYILIDAVLIVLAITIFFQYIHSVRDDTLFEQQKIARDVALSADLIGTLPGEISFNYTSQTNLSEFGFRFDDNKVTVQRTGENLRSQYPFYYDSMINSQFQPMQEPDSIGMIKSRHGFFIGTKTGLSGCPQTNTKGTLGIIMLDPDTDTADIAKTIAKRKTASLTWQGTEPIIERRLQMINVDTPSVIILRKTQGETVISTAGRPQVEKLACLVQQNLDQLGISSTIAASSKEIAVKNTNGIALYIETGDTDHAKLGSAITHALGEYNE